MRDRIATMYRIKNEGRWIFRSLERAYCLAKNVVIWDDGSTDSSFEEALRALGPNPVVQRSSGVTVARSQDAQRVLHWLSSPFSSNVVREKERVNEIRDKNTLWYYCRACVDFDWMLCLDGDEMFSMSALRNIPAQIQIAAEHNVRVLIFPFIYLWDNENEQRVDSVYGNREDGYKKIRFPRAFQISHMEPDHLFINSFEIQAGAGGFHCGSVPLGNFFTNEPEKGSFVADCPIVHFGYIDDDLRHAKFDFYNKIDPNNEEEGLYKHLIGEKNIFASGAPETAVWRDE